MHFEHLVEINDPLMPLLDPLTREQLWRGLERRARQPLDFRPDFDACRLLAAGEDWLSHELTFGRHVYREEVRFEPQRSIRYRIVGEDPHAGSELLVTIEEPAPGALWVRFRYETVIVDTDDSGPALDDARRAAYREADIDTIRRIRRYAALGELG
jgi:hypothetical protein